MRFVRFFHATLLAFSLLLSAGALYSVPAVGTNQDEEAAPPKQPATIIRYVCPMHADVKAKKPGKCPKCKMKLEKKKIKESEVKSPDQ